MPSASHCQTSTAAFEIGARTTRRPRGGRQEEIQMKGCDVVIFKNGKVAVPGCALYMYLHETKRRFPPSQRSGGVALSGGGSHMQTMDMRIDDGRTWLGQLHHFVTLKRMSEVIPLARPGTTDEIAKAVVFLASDDSSYITRTELFVDGGFAQV